MSLRQKIKQENVRVSQQFISGAPTCKWPFDIIWKSHTRLLRWL